MASRGGVARRSGGDGRGSEVCLAVEGPLRDPWGNRNILCLDYMDSNILAMILCYGFARC